VGRKDRERYLRLKTENPDYGGFRGRETVTAPAAPVTETVVCSVCNRRRNVAADTIPEDRSTFVCLRCQKEQAEAPAVPGPEEAAEPG
jgi:hypothetical protein